MRSRSKILAAAALLPPCSVPCPCRPRPKPSNAPMRAIPAIRNPSIPTNWSSSGHQFFGSASRGLALPSRRLSGAGASQRLHPGPGSLRRLLRRIALRRGQALHPQCRGPPHLLAGPLLGFDVGGDGARTMMLVYNMPFTDALYKRFVGIDGSAYFIGGFGVTAVAADEMIVVPIRAGVGARLGVNIGYLKFTSEPTWNPF